ncbi:STAS domain-containing protein [Acidovorax sp. Be4]|uniref:STAS domain-containing protein n=1 Tax=Acidovorax bellezanensis TaxID=2976702 RepID=A0ABT2PJB5_9BURK|nr:STAS domain-containing protein [Acidovorax sp. Be4]MCT9810320.1 STAS domain-containing protein [Acidovorax sp. Be4]
MTKDDSKAGGLFSKVVRFVRHPTVNWSELDALADDLSAAPDKQALRQMLERKRRNDFVRQREFDQLRKLRQKEALSAGAADVPAEPASLPSGFHSSLTSADARAVTVQKIDAIEEQMSQQWWRNKQPADASTLPMELVSALPPLDSVRVAAAPGSGPASLPLGFAPTVPLTWGGEPAPAWPASQRLLQGEERVALATTFAATQLRDPPAWDAIAPSALAGAAPLPAPTFVHDPDFEEAAIAFANGDVVGAEAALLELLALRAAQPDHQQSVWLALFDLYRAAGLAERFDVLAIDFADQVGRSAPLWFSLPAQLGLAGHAAQTPAQEPEGAHAWRWTAPAVMTRQSVAALQAAKGRATTPWTLIWTALERIEADAVPLFERVVTEWAQTPGQIQFLDAQVLVQYLQAQTVSGNREASVDGWRLRMAVLRLMEQHDSFELAALDYCVTYEVSPPSWTQPLSSYVDGSTVDTAAAGAAVADAVAGAVPEAAAAEAVDTAEAAPTSNRKRACLAGCIASDATPWLLALEAQAQAGVPLVVDCSQLIRLDFAAAGSVLNWSAHMQARGHDLCFDRLHQLAAVFFGMIGISEHARLVPRSD